MRALSDVRDVQPVRSNLSRGASFFVGRGRDLREIAASFEAGARLVTITGIGGVGKTRVAVRFAEEHTAWYGSAGAGGTWVCELRGAGETPTLCAVVATVLGISLHTERVSEETIGRALARRGPILLVFDDVGGLTDGAKEALQRWLIDAPGARILATSRVPLGVAGEAHLPLSPLGLPNSATHRSSLPGGESVELFVIRARRACPALVVHAEDLAEVAAVVRRVQGIPLAIELIAARAATGSIGESRERLDRLLALPVTPDDAGRAELLRVVIADVCAQLGEVEEACLLACGAFAGSFTLAALEAVLGNAAPSVLAMLATLHGLSLIRATRVHELGGELRFSLHETIREHIVEQVAGKPELASTMAQRHAKFYAEAGRAFVRRANVEGDSDLLVCRAHDLDNILAAHAFALADPSPTSVIHALDLAIAAELVMRRRGMVELRWRLLDQSVKKGCMADGGLRTDLVTVMLARGRASHQMGRVEEARADFEASLALAIRLGSELHASACHLWIGALAESMDSRTAACESFVRAVGGLDGPSGPIARRYKAEAHVRLACMYSREGDLTAATREIRAAIDLYRTSNQFEEQAAALYKAAVLFMAQHRHDDALLLVDEALTIAQRSGPRQVSGALLLVRGALARAYGDLDLALEHHVRAVELVRSVGDGQREVEAMLGLAEILLARGQRGDARQIVERALVLSAALSDEPDAGAGIVRHVLARPNSRMRYEALLAFRTALTSKFAAKDEPGPPVLRIRAGARAFRPPWALADVELHRRVPLGRILLALARLRIDAPGERLALSDVFAAGWPGEHLCEAGRINRVNVALTALRNIGLRSFLVGGRRGYALTLSCPCELDEHN